MAGERAALRAWVARVVTRRTLLILALICALIASTAFTTVMSVRYMYKMRGYEWFATAIIYPASVCVVQWPVVWLRMAVGRLPASEREFPQWQYALTAFIATLGNVLGGLAQNSVPGPFQVVLGQLAVPLTMGASLVVFGVRFVWTHYLGSALILAGIALGALPDFLSHDASLNGNLGWVLMYASSNIPVTVHFMMKEKWMKASNVDVFYFRTWNALWELASGALIVPLAMLPLPGRSGVAPRDFFHWMGDALSCFAGLSSAPSRCAWSWAVYAGFLAFNIVMNLTMLSVVKYVSAATVQVVTAAAIPLSAVLFLSHALAGPAARTSIDGWTWGAIALVVIGTVTYELRREMKGLQAPALGGENGLGASELGEEGEKKPLLNVQRADSVSVLDD